MAEIRANTKDFKTLHSLYLKSKHDRAILKITLDEAVLEPILILPSRRGPLVETLRGMRVLKGYLRHGYNRVRRRCPLNRFRMCKCEKCAFYLIQGITGDCIYIWNYMQGEQQIQRLPQGK